MSWTSFHTWLEALENFERNAMIKLCPEDQFYDKGAGEGIFQKFNVKHFSRREAIDKNKK